MAIEEALLEAIKDSASRQEKTAERMFTAISGVSDDVRGLATAISKGFASGGRRDTNGSSWQLLFAVGALIFGLMTPMYIMVASVGGDVGSLDSRMLQDDTREIKDKQQAARMAERFTEVETQFRGMSERITMEHNRQDYLVEDNRSWIKQHTGADTILQVLMAGMEQRLQVIERASP